MTFAAARALELLRAGLADPAARFRPGQQEAIRHVVQGDGRLLLVQKTGWGKSFVYFIAAKLLREAGLGPALLVSPLLALMRNQIAAAERMGLCAQTINSDNAERWRAVEEEVRHDRVDLLLISPERLANERFRAHVLASLAPRIALLVIDEAHCISDWGHDFRPHYRLIERIAATLPANLRVLATTATANDRVLADLSAVLGPDLQIARGDLARPSLALQTIRLPGQAERLAWLAERLPALPGSGVVYTLTVRDAEQVARWLRARGIAVEPYTSMSGPRRAELEQALLDNRLKALIATTALGMGFDKPDLAFVIHYQAPPSVVDYYQQVGRAGRALDAAYGVLLSGAEELAITDYFIDSAFPTRDQVTDVLAALEAQPDGLSMRELEAEVNAGNGRIAKTIELLSLESPAPLARLDGRWQLTAAPLADAFWERTRRLTDLRLAEREQMQRYVRLTSGHMAFLIRSLDGEPGDCRPPHLPALPAAADPARVQEAIAFLRRSSLRFEPRKQWPAGRLIARTQRAQPGRALCIWNDAGWGGMVRDGKYRDDRFCDELLDACVALVREWRPIPAPCWVTAIPSHRRPHLVGDFARRLAAKLHLPFSEALERTEKPPPQKMMANAQQRARNVKDSLVADRSAVLAGPVLLVDDLVDSRWTFTVAAWKLSRAGSGPVWPFALADTRGTR